jgi:membrane-associated protease RseP (regulator of RpoE activity)
MLKHIKTTLALLFIVSAILAPIYAQEPCDKCKANPDSCKLLQTGKCDDCNSDKKIVEKKIIVMTQDEDRGFLGVVTEKTDNGLTITKIVPSSPAEKAGLKANDIILQVEAKSVKTPDDLIGALKGTKPKDEVTIKIKTKGEEKSLKIILAEVPKTETKVFVTVSPEGKSYEIDKEMMTPEMKCPKCGTKISMPTMCSMTTEEKCPMMSMEKGQMMGKCSECGMTENDMEMCLGCQKKMGTMPIMPMGKQMEKDFMVMPPKETRGFLGVVTEEEDGKLVVDQVVPNSPAEKAGIKEDDVIAEINGTAVTNPTELIDALKNTKPGDIANFKILSGSAEKTMDITLGEVPTPPQPTMPRMQMRMRMRGEGKGAGYFGPGFTFFKYDDLNTLFTQHGMDLIEKQQFVFSGGGWGQGKRIRIGGYGIGGAKIVSNDSLDIEVGYGAGFFELGYAIVNKINFMLTPLVGIGGGGLSMKITPKYNRPTSLTGLINSPWGVAKVSKGGIAMYPGLAIDIPFGFVGITLKGGYMWSPMNGPWTLENLGSIGNQPDLKLNGPFATVGIMFGGNSSHRYK